jgi:uncharacterized protein
MAAQRSKCPARVVGRRRWERARRSYSSCRAEAIRPPAITGSFTRGNKAANWRDHGVSFHDAIKALSDRFAVERFDDREDYGEERINLLGMYEGVILHVTYTERGERIRIISARRATRHEQDDYYRENAR